MKSEILRDEEKQKDEASETTASLPHFLAFQQ